MKEKRGQATFLNSTNKCQKSSLSPFSIQSAIFIVLMFLSVEAKSGAGFKDQCESCHGQLFDKWDAAKVAHYPYKEGECLSCHAEEHKKFNQPTKNELCLACHTDLIKQGDKVIHPGFQIQECTDCHNPHASSFDKLLNKL